MDSNCDTKGWFYDVKIAAIWDATPGASSLVNSGQDVSAITLQVNCPYLFGTYLQKYMTSRIGAEKACNLIYSIFYFYVNHFILELIPASTYSPRPDVLTAALLMIRVF